MSFNMKEEIAISKKSPPQSSQIEALKIVKVKSTLTSRQQTDTPPPPKKLAQMVLDGWLSEKHPLQEESKLDADVRVTYDPTKLY